MCLCVRLCMHACSANATSCPCVPQFFIAPLISADGVDREINAVDSENGKNLQLDMWRQLSSPSIRPTKPTHGPSFPQVRIAAASYFLVFESTFYLKFLT